MFNIKHAVDVHRRDLAEALKIVVAMVVATPLLLLVQLAINNLSGG